MVMNSGPGRRLLEETRILVVTMRSLHGTGTCVEIPVSTCLKRL